MSFLTFKDIKIHNSRKAIKYNKYLKTRFFDVIHEVMGDTIPLEWQEMDNDELFQSVKRQVLEDELNKLKKRIKI